MYHKNRPELSRRHQFLVHHSGRQTGSAVDLKGSAGVCLGFRTPGWNFPAIGVHGRLTGLLFLVSIRHR